MLGDRPRATAAEIPDTELEDDEEGVEIEADENPARFLAGNTSPKARENSFPHRKRVRASQETHTRLTGNDIYELANELTKELPLADAGRSPVADVIEIWNAMALSSGLPKARDTTKRRKVIAARLKEQGWFEDFRTACAVIGASAFHRGGNDRRWVATLDYALQVGKATTLAEQASARPAAPPAAPQAPGGVRVGSQIFAVSAFWQLCTSSGLASRGQSRTALEERIARLAADGRVTDPAPFLSLVLHVQPWELAQISFDRTRDERLAAVIASWQPPAPSEPRTDAGRRHEGGGGLPDAVPAAPRAVREPHARLAEVGGHAFGDHHEL